MSADYDNFSHGDETNVGRVFKARWWQVWRWLGWLLFRCLGQAAWLTLTTGETLAARG